MTPRRTVLKAGAAALIAAPLTIPRLAQAASAVTFVGWGGLAEKVNRKQWFDPFTAETGIAVQYVNGPELAKVKAQVESNNVQWDVVDNFGYQAAKEGLAEPLDFKIIDPTRFIAKPPPFAVPAYGYVGVIAWDPKRSKQPPKDFSQFFDAQKFPGRRGLRTRVSEMLEIALLADGVAADKLYPLDVERAFKSLDRLKPHVKKWFGETAQGISLIQTSEVDYTYTYLNRVVAAKESGVSIECSLAQTLIGQSYFFVPKGSPRKEAAMRLLEFITRPQQQAAKLNGGDQGLYSSVKGVEKFLTPEARKLLPDPSSSRLAFMSDEFWATRYVELDKRFKEWILT